MIKIAMADDHMLLRDALAEVINSFDDCEVVCQADTGRALVDYIARNSAPDMVILDLGMPDMDGYDTAQWLHEHQPQVRIMMLTMYNSEMMIVRQLRAGVKGFVKKNIHRNELKMAIYTVMKGGFHFSPDIIKTLINPVHLNPLMPALPVNKELNEREIMFIRLTCTDHTYKEIAGMMNLGPRAVDSIRDDLFERLEVKSRVGLAIFAMRQGLVAL